MMKHFAFVAALALAGPVHAQTTVDPDQVMTLLKNAGYPAEHFGDQSGYRQVMSETGDYQFSVDLFDCTAGKACSTMLFYTAFRPSDKTPTKEAIAAYSSQQPAGRMFVNRSGSPVIELELDLGDDALTPARFADSLKTWDTMLVAFGNFLSGRPSPAAPAPAAATAESTTPAPAGEVADAG